MPDDRARARARARARNGGYGWGNARNDTIVLRFLPDRTAFSHLPVSLVSLALALALALAIVAALALAQPRAARNATLARRLLPS
jgi:hypothetical protein